MKRIVVITTDGSIVSGDEPMVGGSVPALKGEEFLSLLPSDGISLAFEEFSRLPGSHFTPVRALELAQRVESVLLTPDVDGVVITHGTDTLEETAYLLHLTINTAKPVVLTGSLRAANGIGYDGVLNLARAIRVAAAHEARDMGVLVVLNENIHTADDLQQMHSQSINAFQSPEGGPLGHIDAHHIRLRCRPLARQYIPCSRVEESVELLRVTQGVSDRLLRHCIEERVAGLVVETFGGGRVPPWWLPLLNEAIAQRMVVAVTTRCPAGGLGDEYGYVGAYHHLRRLGVLLVHNLNGTKARIKLMVALGAARSNDELRRWFQ